MIAKYCHTSFDRKIQVTSFYLNVFTHKYVIIYFITGYKHFNSRYLDMFLIFVFFCLCT